MNRTIRAYLIVSFMALAAMASCWAQFAQRGGVEGFVFDNSGAVIVGANLTLTDLAENHSMHTVSDGTGHFALR